MPCNHEIKDYLDRRFGKETASLHAIRTESVALDTPDIHIPIHLGRLLYLLVTIQSPDRILEIGTLHGYSAAWMALGLKPSGKIISLEVNRHYAEKARDNFAQCREKRVEIRIGHAVELMAEMVEKEESPFDLIFIDGNKEDYALYLDWSIRLSRPGTLMVIDNLIPKGAKVGFASHLQAEEVYAFNDYLAQHPLIEVAVLPTLVGEDARLDGVALCRVKGLKTQLLCR